ncbi:MAG TPA: PepSY domain-containing protein [Dongiaceae bacterium]
MRTYILAACAASLMLAPVAARADWFSEELPPANAKPLSEIIKSLEDQGYKAIENVEFDDNVWEIEVHKAGGEEVELHVDPVSGQIVKTE